jgi:hypothetical protein
LGVAVAQEILFLQQILKKKTREIQPHNNILTTVFS